MDEAVNLSDKFKRDKNFKKLCRDFFEMAENANKDTARQSGKRLLVRNSRTFYADDTFSASIHKVITACVTKLGSKLGSEKEVEKLLWKQVCEGRSGKYAESAENFINLLIEQAKSNYTYVCSNKLFRFSDNISRVKIGPVEIIRISNPANDIFDGKVDPNWELTIGKEYAFSASEFIKIQLPSICWKVSTRASQLNVKEEAEWLIDVAISFLRLSQYEHLSIYHGFFPEVGGKPEPMPCIVPESETRYLLLTEDGVSTGGMWVPPQYIIDDTIIAATLAGDFKSKAHAIFNPTKGSLAERFGQGLGWLTRGRQSEDRAERLLFFFTAIESLLSDNKDAPITQTIANNASVILSDNPAARESTVKKTKALYADRSKLVHAGRRGVSWAAVSTVGTIAEEIYMKVLERIPLTETFKSFQENLCHATCGLPWLPAKDSAGTAGSDKMPDLDVQG